LGPDFYSAITVSHFGRNAYYSGGCVFQNGNGFYRLRRIVCRDKIHPDIGIFAFDLYLVAGNNKLVSGNKNIIDRFGIKIEVFINPALPACHSVNFNGNFFGHPVQFQLGPETESNRIFILIVGFISRSEGTADERMN